MADSKHTSPTDRGAPIILLMGPTAAGKTDIAITLCERYDMEIVSVDSAQIYRDMNIGTAKPDAEVLAKAPHHLIDIRDPSESYSVAEFVNDAQACIDNIRGRGKQPLFCGGTMLYFKAITEGISELPTSDDTTREAVEHAAADKGWQAMHDELAQIDPDSAARIHPNDPQRIQRALEVYHMTGESITEWTRKHPPQGLAYDLRKIAISPADRSVLHQRIEARFDAMLADGFLEEVESLRDRGDLDINKPAMRCVGYRQLWQHLDGEFPLEEARLKGIYATRQLAKRQLTWLRSMAGVEWFNPSGPAGSETSDLERFMGEIFPEA